MSNLETSIIAVEPGETARWLARLNQVRLAVDTTPVITGGWDPDVPNFAALKEETEKHPAFEHAVLFQIKQHLGGNAAQNLLTPNVLDDSVDDARRKTLCEGLSRIGIVDKSTRDFRLGALAALHFLRGNIKEKVDRAIYNDWEFIEDRAVALNASAPISRVKRNAYFRGRDQVMDVSVYSVASYGYSGLPYNPALKDEPRDERFWWDELTADLHKIDDASDRLQIQSKPNSN